MALSQSIRALLKDRKQNELEALIVGSKPQDVIDLLVACIHRPGEGFAMWNAILMGYATDQPVANNAPSTTATLFRVALATLEQLNKVEVPQKHCFDIVIRLFAELRRFDAFQLIELTEFCIDSLRLGDPKCLAWKDLLPELIKLLHQHDQLMVNGVPMSGAEYREQCVRQICTMRWPSSVLTPITLMFKEMPISKVEKMQVLHKICDNLDQLEPTELPPIAYQLFRLCNTAALVLIPVHGLSQYFQKHFYAHVFAEMDSDQSNLDSIEQYSAREMQLAQETILYHLANATEFRVDERDIVAFCRPMSSTPRFMLSPFFLCALLSISATNRYPESTVLSTSQIMPFLRSLIQNSATEAQMCGRSAWARSTMMRPGTELSKILDVLVDQSLDGKEIVTPGIVWLAFALLKSGKAAPELHHLATGFLEKFVKKRFIFGAGIVRNIVDFLLADLEAVQFSDCLTRLSLTNTYTVSECLASLQRVLDYLLLIPGAHAMRMMTFIIPLCKSSQKVRDLFIEMLRKAMYQRDSGTRQMGVYGFCLVLKHLRENNARRSSTATGHVLATIGGGATGVIGGGSTQQQRLGYVFSQQSISGYSLMSQTLLDTDANPQRHFDMLALEIIGVLRKCFNQTYEVKAVLYEGLHRAIDFNPKLTPHIVQFLEWHFHKYFDDGVDTSAANDDAADPAPVNDTAELTFRLGDVLRDLNGSVSVWDHVGHLVQLMGHCVCVCRRKGQAQEVRTVSARLETLQRRIGDVNVERVVGLVDSGGVMDMKVMHLGGQFLNCLEALMGYALWSHAAEQPAGLEVLLKLFKQHRAVMEMLKASNVVKKTKKDKNSTAPSQPAARRPVAFDPVNIWELATLERFLRVVFDDDVSFATAAATEPLRKNKDFGRFVLRVSLAHIQALPAVAEAKHTKHSQSTFAQLGNITRVLWSQCVRRLQAMCTEYDVATAQLSCECFMQCLLVAGQLYAKKLAFFLQAISFEPTNTSLGHNCAIFLAVLQTTMDKCLSGALHDGKIGEARIERTLLQCIEWLLDHLPADYPFAIDAYKWLYNTCLEYNVADHHIDNIHRMLFVQRMRTNTGSFFDSIARQCQQLLSDEPSAPPAFTLKSIDAGTVDACVLQLCTALRQQIEDVEYFVTKAKSLLAKLRIVGPTASESCVHDMRCIEQKCSAQLILVAQAAIPLTTVGLPAGQCTDAVVRLLLDFYVCVANFTKHLLVRHASAAVSYAAIKFDRLMRTAGRPLAERVYDLIEHIENDVFADEKYSSNGAADGAKVLRATRLLPKLVMRIENVNKFVMALGKKTRVDLSAHLHIGTVRDFKIKKTALRKALDSSLAEESAQNDASVSTTGGEEAEWHDSEEEEGGEDTLTEGMREPATDQEDDDEGGINASTTTTASTPPSIPASSTTTTGILLEHSNADLTRPEMALKNMAIMNARLKRRRTDENGEDNSAAKIKAPAGAKKKKKTQRVPQVINKASTSAGGSLARRSTRNNRSDSTTTMD